MFFSRRATQAECLDSPDRTIAEIEESYQELARINHLFNFAEPYQRFIPQILGEDKCRSLTLLDLGAGDCSLGKALATWAAKRGWSWDITNLDISEQALQLCHGGKTVVGSVLALPFKNESFDVVIANQMTHHLTSDDDIVQHFREAWRVSRRAVLLSDLHRNVLLYGIIWMILTAGEFPNHFRSDGLLSIKRGFRQSEWETFAQRAGMRDSHVWVYYAARVMLSAVKKG